MTMLHVLNCKEVTTRLALGDLSHYPWTERLTIQFHMAICWVCRKYERQMKIIRNAFQASAAEHKKSLDTPEFRQRLEQTLRHLP